jgi:hypothetical protein
VLTGRKGPYSLQSNIHAVDIDTTAYREHEIDALAIRAPLRAIRTGPPEIAGSFGEGRVVYISRQILDLTTISRDKVKARITASHNTQI